MVNPDTSASVTLTPSETAKYIGMSASWLAQARMRGDPKAPPFLKIGKSIRYLRSDLDQWLLERRQVYSTQDGGLS